MLKAEFSIALWVSNGYWMVLWEPPSTPFLKKKIFQTMNHTFTLNILKRGSPVPYWWSSTLQLYLRTPRKDTVRSPLCTPSAPSVIIEGKKTHTNVISLSSVGLINLRTVWIPLPTKWRVQDWKKIWYWLQDGTQTPNWFCALYRFDWNKLETYLRK